MLFLWSGTAYAFRCATIAYTFTGVVPGPGEVRIHADPRSGVTVNEALLAKPPALANGEGRFNAPVEVMLDGWVPLAHNRCHRRVRVVTVVWSPGGKEPSQRENIRFEVDVRGRDSRAAKRAEVHALNLGDLKLAFGG